MLENVLQEHVFPTTQKFVKKMQTVMALGSAVLTRVAGRMYV